MTPTYIDSRGIVPHTRDFEAATTPLQGVHLNAPHVDVFIAEEQRRRQGRLTARQRSPRETRQDRRVTNEQKLELTEVFRRDRDDLFFDCHLQRVGVRLSRTSDFLSKLRDWKGVTPSGRRSREKKHINENGSIDCFCFVSTQHFEQ